MFRLDAKLVSAALLAALIAGSASAGVDVRVGDKDGYGYGRPDISTGIAWPGAGPSGTDYDGRDAAEKAATNGAQITDVYSALTPLFGNPNPFTSADVLFPFAGALTPGAEITIAMGDFQCSQYGAMDASINGTPVPFCFDDGFENSTIRDFVLSSAEIAAANAAHEAVLHIDRGASTDFVAFDWFELRSGVPEPAAWAMLMLGLGMIGLAARRRRDVGAAAA